MRENAFRIFVAPSCQDDMRPQRSGILSRRQSQAAAPRSSYGGDQSSTVSQTPIPRPMPNARTGWRATIQRSHSQGTLARMSVVERLVNVAHAPAGPRLEGRATPGAPGRGAQARATGATGSGSSET